MNMNRPMIPAELEQAIRKVAQQKGLRLRYDTHFDAGNLEIQWWTGKILNRLDFQPIDHETIQVTWLKDLFPFCPKTLNWARGLIPYFPHTAKTDSIVFGNIKSGETEAIYRNKILGYLQKAA